MKNGDWQPLKSYTSSTLSEVKLIIIACCLLLYCTIFFFIPYRNEVGTLTRYFGGSNGHMSLEDAWNVTKCTIDGNMPVYVYNHINSEESMNIQIELKNNAYKLVDNPSDACFVISLVDTLPTLDPIHNHLIINLGERIESGQLKAVLVQEFAPGRSFDIFMDPRVPAYDINDWKNYSKIFPVEKENFITLLNPSTIDRKKFGDIFKDVPNRIIDDESEINSIFCLLEPSEGILKSLSRAVRNGCVPVVLKRQMSLPLDDFIDWTKLLITVPETRFVDLNQILATIEDDEIVEMRRLLRTIFMTYFGDQRAVARTILAAIRHRLGIPVRQLPYRTASIEGFDHLSEVESKKIPSEKYSTQFLEFTRYSKYVWNDLRAPWRSLEYLPLSSHPLQNRLETNKNAHGKEFRSHLGGNAPLEQFTVVILSYDRDTSLKATLEHLDGLPYLQKVIVVWNGITRKLPDDWPKIHVPIHFTNPGTNKINNRFLPLDLIETEAILMLDDDVIIKQDAIHLGFRVWREYRDRLVGFMIRKHSGYGNSTNYVAEGSCEYSMVITDSAFFHKDYLRRYTEELPEAVQNLVNEKMNCEDIAMNFLVAHATQKPPLKVTKHQKQNCHFDCSKGLSVRPSHYQARTDCIRFFMDVYGYNPLRFSQYRADSVSYGDEWKSNDRCFLDV